jgi:hypothetical protein
MNVITSKQRTGNGVEWSSHCLARGTTAVSTAYCVALNVISSEQWTGNGVEWYGYCFARGTTPTDV